MIRRCAIPILILGCLGALVLACFGRALLRNQQFAYRDAAHFYYPLYHRVQQEWEAGRIPLWEPEENGGMPLLGNPTAAVLYPGKIVFALMPYPWAARTYVVAHTLLAFLAMLALMRTWSISWTGSTIGALAYAFGGPVLFQYCNIIYLVGAAWVPLGFRAVDRWLRLGKRLALVELAFVLAMETLGGDPECAYLTGLCAGGYAAALAWTRRQRDRSEDAGEGRRSRRLWWLVPAGLLLGSAWVAGTIAGASLAPRFRPTNFPPVPLPWMPWVAPAVLAVWGLAALVVLWKWRRARRSGRARPTFVPMLAGLGLAAILAVAITAAQLLPVLEFTSRSSRAAGGGPHDIYPFSVQPWRVVEFVWPNPFGTPFQGNRSWLAALPPEDKPVKIWVPTLYLGGLTLVLGLGALRLGGRGAPPWQVWISVVAVMSLLGSFGEFTSPLFYARYASELVPTLGPHDKPDDPALRFDGYLRDGDGSLYWLFTTLLPGFRQFRFPAKLMTFTVMALGVLAGQGWDDLLRGARPQRRRTIAWASALLALTAVVLTAAVLGRADLQRWLATKTLDSSFGPLDQAGAVGESIRGLGQAALVLAIALVLVVKAHRRPALAAAVALVLLTADLAAANARYVLTLPQALMDAEPEVLRIIQDAEARQPSPGPFRVHRMPIWSPPGWIETVSSDRVRDFVEWERGTLQPKYGIDLGVHFTLTFGVAELYDYEWFFGSFTYTVRDDLARALGVEPKTKVVVYPRRSFDFWTTRYFVLPYFPAGWTDENRGFASFLDRTERIHPAPDAFQGPDGKDRELAWLREHDVQVRRNLAVYPRAWVVHSARWMKPIDGMGRQDRERPFEEIMFSNDPLWFDLSRTLYDARQVVWVDQDEKAALLGFLRDTAALPSERVDVVRYEPDRVELDASLESPGMVVLADVYYPGWTLTIDGQPAPIYRANRMMRGAAVPAGRHRLVYTFRPQSFRVGLGLSCVGLVASGLLAGWFVRRPLDPTLAPTQGARATRGDLA